MRLRPQSLQRPSIPCWQRPSACSWTAHPRQHSFHSTPEIQRSRTPAATMDPASTPTPVPSTDYTTWSSDSLISRITNLERQLHAAQQRDPQQLQPRKHHPLSNPTPPKKKPRKRPSPFDPSKYHTRHIALKFAYLGARYNGFEHHANNVTPLPTVEEALWRALRKTRLIFPTFPEGKEQRDDEGEEEVCWDGTDYSKCGRTDRGVSAFGQVVGLKVRSARPKKVRREDEGEGKVRRQEAESRLSAEQGVAVQNSGAEGSLSDVAQHQAATEENDASPTPAWDDIHDELPYIQLLNRVLPPDIRILAWCPHPPADFSARFNCRERRYRYFFTNPAYAPTPFSTSDGEREGCLDIAAMQAAAKKYEGLHDFRNFCKSDPSKQITNFERRIFQAGIHRVGPEEAPASFATRPPFVGEEDGSRRGDMQVTSRSPDLFYFEVRGSAFLWHQVRHLVAILFLVGQGYEQPSLIDELLDIQKTPEKPVYEMASDFPLVLWDCVFPDASQTADVENAEVVADGEVPSYRDALEWIFTGDVGGRDRSKRATAGLEDGKYGRNGIMDDLWSLWRKRKMDEVLAGSLMDIVAQLGDPLPRRVSEGVNGSRATLRSSDRVFEGSEEPRSVGIYKPVMQRDRTEAPEVVNARWAGRKGLNGGRRVNGDSVKDA